MQKHLQDQLTDGYFQPSRGAEAPTQLLRNFPETSPDRKGRSREHLPNWSQADPPTAQVPTLIPMHRHCVVH